MTDHICLNVVVKLSSHKPCRPYRSSPIVVAEVPLNHGQCVLDVGVRLEGNETLCDFGDSNSTPCVKEIVGVLVFCPVPKGKCLENGKGAWTAHRNVPG